MERDFGKRKAYTLRTKISAQKYSLERKKEKTGLNLKGGVPFKKSSFNIKLQEYGRQTA
jgi:hypothetical protein